LAVLDFNERSRLTLLKTKYLLQQEHIKNIESIINITRKEKHEFANHLNTIYGLCTLNKPDLAERIKHYINDITGKSYYSYKSIDTGNDYIDALITVKKNYAIDKGISLKIDIRSPLSQADIQDTELVAVFANIIENAFDALLTGAENANNTGYICITTYIIQNSYYISIKNNGPVIPKKNLKRIFSEGFSTKTVNRTDHGYGLYIANQGIVKNGGFISVTSSELETEFLVKLRVKNEYIQNTGSEAV
jgi:sensor histidine kinase regulating citrate/malate metabolism